MTKYLYILSITYLTCSCDAPTDQTKTPTAELLVDSTSNVTVDSLTGLIVAQHFDLVRAQCTACHSAKLITQNQATREGWEQMIRWMQASQGLWDLGENEPLILDYLTQYYGPKRQGRRKPLLDIEWYELKE